MMLGVEDGLNSSKWGGGETLTGQPIRMKMLSVLQRKEFEVSVRASRKGIRLQWALRGYSTRVLSELAPEWINCVKSLEGTTAERQKADGSVLQCVDLFYLVRNPLANGLPGLQTK